MIRSASIVWTIALGAVLAAPVSAANVWLSLNLDFNTPGDETSGGTWLVVGKADERGLAGVSLVLNNVNFNASGFLAPMEFEVRQFAAFGTIINIVEGDDMTDRSLDIGVIGGPFPSSYVDAPGLVPYSGGPNLGSFTGGVELATGTFNPGVVPTWATLGNNSTAANVFSPDPGNPAVGAVVDVTAATQMTVRVFAVPEPATLSLVGVALMGVVAAARRLQA